MGKVTADPTTGQIIDAHAVIAGLEPIRVNGTTIYLTRGTVADTDGNLYSSPDRIYLDITTVGPGGRDGGSLTNGQSYQIYILLDNLTGDLTAVLSTSISYTYVVYDPLTHTLLRKLQFGFVYNSAWGGIPALHISCWPNPYIRLTQAEDIAPWRVLAAGVESPDPADFNELDLNSILPDAARLVDIKLRVEPGTTDGSAYVRTNNAQSIGLLVGSVKAKTAYGANLVTTLTLQTTSTGKIDWRCAGGCKLTIVVLGYFMTEDS